MNGVVVKLVDDMPGLGLAGDYVVANNDRAAKSGEHSVISQNGRWMIGRFSGGRQISTVIRQEQLNGKMESFSVNLAGN